MKSAMQDLYAACSGCEKCALAQTRTNLVFGVGDDTSRVLFIGEGPGEKEDLQGEPFVGRAGQLLDRMLEAVGLSREQIYIANIVKCRPPKNRDPLPEEKEACIGWLFEQIRIIDPAVIVCLGRIASAVIINENIRISKEHGQFVEKDGRLMMPMLHPAAILRNPNLKPEAFDDFCTLRDKLAELNTR